MNDHHREHGIAVIVAMMGILIISALGTALVLGTTTETLIARNFRSSAAASYAADFAMRVVVEELAAAPDWNPVLSGSIRSRFTDGSPSGERTLADRSTIDLAVLSDLANCGKVTTCSGADMSKITVERPWGTNNPQWRPFAYGKLSDLSSAASESHYYGIVFVADDPSEIDGDPLADGVSPNPGTGVIVLRAAVFGPGGVRVSVESTIARRDPTELSVMPGVSAVRMVSWRIGP
jgi:hypothetical protein